MIMRTIYVSLQFWARVATVWKEAHNIMHLQSKRYACYLVIITRFNYNFPNCQIFWLRYTAQKTLRILANCFAMVRICGDSHQLRVVHHSLANNASRSMASLQGIWILDHKGLNVFLSLWCAFYSSRDKEVIAHNGIMIHKKY